MNKDLNFEYIEDFADYIVNRVEGDEDLFLTVVGKFEEIKNIIKEMMVLAYIDFENINLESPNVNGYGDEYVLDCWCTDGIVEIGCEPVKRDGIYINLISDETYLLENVSSKIISSCDSSELYFVNIDSDCDCDECCFDCCDCDGGDECSIEYAETENSDIHGFTASKTTENEYCSYSFYTSGALSKDEIRSILKEIGF